MCVINVFSYIASRKQVSASFACVRAGVCACVNMFTVFSVGPGYISLSFIAYVCICVAKLLPKAVCSSAGHRNSSSPHTCPERCLWSMMVKKMVVN